MPRGAPGAPWVPRSPRECREPSSQGRGSRAEPPSRAGAAPGGVRDAAGAAFWQRAAPDQLRAAGPLPIQPPPFPAAARKAARGGRVSPALLPSASSPRQHRAGRAPGRPRAPCPLLTGPGNGTGAGTGAGPEGAACQEPALPHCDQDAAATDVPGTDGCGELRAWHRPSFCPPRLPCRNERRLKPWGGREQHRGCCRLLPPPAPAESRCQKDLGAWLRTCPASASAPDVLQGGCPGGARPPPRPGTAARTPQPCPAVPQDRGDPEPMGTPRACGVAAARSPPRSRSRISDKGAGRRWDGEAAEAFSAEPAD